MRKFLAFLLIALVLASAPCAFAGTGFGMNGNEFLGRLASVFYRIRGGFNSNGVTRAERTSDGLLLNYNSAIFLTIDENAENHEVTNVAAVLLTQGAEPERQFMKGSAPSDTTLFENICLQIVFALNPKLSDAHGQEILTQIGGNGQFLDGRQRSAEAGGYCFILKQHKNGMAVMVADRME